MTKCDIIIPVYNAPEYVEMCLFALYQNTNIDEIGTVFLLNDNSNEITYNMLQNVAKKYKKIKLVNNKENLGFIKNVNNGFSMCKEKYVLLLNTDCFVAKNTVSKLMGHMKKNEKIGLICPICSNAANLTLKMFPGFSYMMMDDLLEKKFKGITFDACTVVGNCLMISKKCIDEVGYFDEIYGMGYGDETDYQFKSMEKGFEAKVAIDTYVFHKAEQSFNTTNKKRSERLEKNRKIFFDRWGEQYNKLLKKYLKNDPIKYINDNLKNEDKIPKLDFAFVLPQMGKGTGGVIYITELVNYLSILGLKIGMLNLYPGSYDEIMNFESITPKIIEKMHIKYLIATIFDSVFFAKKLSEKTKSKIIYFSQGYEFMFLDGTRYAEVECSFKLVDYVITISNYLKNNYEKMFNINPIKIENGINYNMLHSNKELTKNNKRKSIIMNLRNESLKGGFVLNDIIKKLTIECKNIDINIVNNSKKSDICINDNNTINLNIIDGPISRTEMYNLIKKADILIDSSFSEGFGLLPLEAMTCGTVPVVSNALGNVEYCIDGKNCFLINEVNNSQKYVDRVKEILASNDLFNDLKQNCIKTSEKYDFEKIIFKFYESLNNILENRIEGIDKAVSSIYQEKLKKYMLSDFTYERMMFACKTNYSNDLKPTRRGNLKILAKEFVKSNVYLFKQTVKSIIHKGYKL